MKRLRKLVWISAGVLVVGIIATSVAPSAIAQVRAALVRDMDSAVRGARYGEAVSPNFTTGAFSLTEVVTPVIPTGKKLFLQRISTHTLLTDGQSPMQARVTVGSTNPAVFQIDQDFQAQNSTSNPQRHFTGNQQLDVLLSPGESVSVFIFRNGNDGQSSLNFANISLVGYFVDATP